MKNDVDYEYVIRMRVIKMLATLCRLGVVGEQEEILVERIRTFTKEYAVNKCI